MKDRDGVNDFLIEEARLIDDGDLDQWLDLFADDALYWIPSNGRDIDPAREVSIIYDDKARLKERVFRAMSGASWAQSPRSSTLHFVSNVRSDVYPSGEIVVRSNVLVVELRVGTERSYAGRCEHHLLRVDGYYKITRKRIDLLLADEPISSLTFIL